MFFNVSHLLGFFVLFYCLVCYDRTLVHYTRFISTAHYGGFAVINYLFLMERESVQATGGITGEPSWLNFYNSAFWNAGIDLVFSLEWAFEQKILFGYLYVVACQIIKMPSHAVSIITRVNLIWICWAEFLHCPITSDIFITTPVFNHYSMACYMI